MTRSGSKAASWRGWGLAAIALCMGQGAQAQPDRPAIADNARPAAASAPAGTPPAGSGGAVESPQQQPSSPVATAAVAPATSPPAPASPPAAPPHAADPTEGDRTALIDQDVAQHPPQTAIASRDPSHLQTAKMKLGGLLDRSVHSLDNSEVGRVIDVMTGDDGKPAALELDVGGFMGVGNRRIAVAWALFDLSRTGQNDPLRVALSAAQVRSAPAMDDNGAFQVVTGATPVSAAPSASDAPAAAAAPAPPGPALPPGPVLATPPAAPPVLPPVVTPPAVTPVGAPPAPAPVPPTAPVPPDPERPTGKPAPHSSDNDAARNRSGSAAQPAGRDAPAMPRSRNGENRF